ncbi:MAG: 8-oxo-dGTP diphosphatase MutT [Pseudomonadota bacterium]
MPETKVIRVSAGILIDDQRRFLIAERSASVHGPGFWEFPGGKIESRETPIAALRRELNEELGITIADAKPALQKQHTYKERTVELYFFVVDDWDGAPIGVEGQPLKWCDIDALDAANLLPANREVVAWLREEFLADA